MVAADRGHFAWSLALGEALVRPKVVQEAAVVPRVEFWTNDESAAWVREAFQEDAAVSVGAWGEFGARNWSETLCHAWK